MLVAVTPQGIHRVLVKAQTPIPNFAGIDGRRYPLIPWEEFLQKEKEEQQRREEERLRKEEEQHLKDLALEEPIVVSDITPRSAVITWGEIKRADDFTEAVIELASEPKQAKQKPQFKEIARTKTHSCSATVIPCHDMPVRASSCAPRTGLTSSNHGTQSS
eukprot:m.89371 g.89371  ORF g.89371 m.89371 type:complete len:161 (-) comp14575_c0_seq3:43-525(-)